ncbi:MAG TPA: hypothetical protein VGE90_01130 [Chitinophaga sp.]
MRTTLLAFLTLLLIYCKDEQIAFSNIDCKVEKTVSPKGTEIRCTGASLSLKFQLTQQAVELQDNFITVDSQLIQISALQVSGNKKPLNTLDETAQQQFLSDYSKYEIDYFTKELHVEVIHPSSQWVTIGARNWFVWYFRVGKAPAQAGQKVWVQYFTSTIIDDKVLTLNAPIFVGADFAKAGLIVDQMIRSLSTNNPD